MAIEIPIKDNPNHSLLIEIESRIYQFIFRYNSKHDFWTIDISTENGIELLVGIKIVANYPLLFSHKNSFLPSGDIIARIVDKDARINRNSFKDGLATLLYLSEYELKTI
jgi:hypothetical protein